MRVRAAVCTRQNPAKDEPEQGIQHRHPQASTIAKAAPFTSLRLLDLPNLIARTAAIRQLVLEAPAPVVASMLGYHPATTETLAIQAGATWMRYAPGDHTRR
jgi:hypothetical protein